MDVINGCVNGCIKGIVLNGCDTTETCNVRQGKVKNGCDK